VVETVGFTAPVFSAFGISPTLRSFSVPPVGNGYLLHDVRIGPEAVRTFTGREMWRLHQHFEAVAEELLAKGCTDAQLGQWAGSSIPRSMASRQVHRLNKRVQLMHAVEELVESTRVPWVHVGAPSCRDVGAKRTLLAAVTWGGPAMMLTHQHWPLIPGVVADAALSREALTTRAVAWARKLFKRSSLHGLLAAEMNRAEGVTRVVVVPLTKAEPVEGAEWMAVADLHPVMRDIAKIALARLAAFGEEAHELGELHVTPRLSSVKRLKTKVATATSEGVWREGQTGAMWLQPSTMGDKADARPWEVLISQLRKNQELLMRDIRAVDSDAPAFVWLQETADRMSPPTLEDFPTELLESVRDYADPALGLHPLPSDFTPPTTA